MGMKNKYKARCWYCKVVKQPGTAHLERREGIWGVHCFDCQAKARETMGKFMDLPNIKLPVHPNDIDVLDSKYALDEREFEEIKRIEEEARAKEAKWEAVQRERRQKLDSLPYKMNEDSYDTLLASGFTEDQVRAIALAISNADTSSDYGNCNCPNCDSYHD